MTTVAFFRLDCGVISKCARGLKRSPVEENEEENVTPLPLFQMGGGMVGTAQCPRGEKMSIISLALDFGESKIRQSVPERQDRSLEYSVLWNIYNLIKQQSWSWSPFYLNFASLLSALRRRSRVASGLEWAVILATHHGSEKPHCWVNRILKCEYHRLHFHPYS